ncbi:FAD-dependent oxidoreductase [Paraeggerthella hongkongensis]|uniref:NADH:flavin oxidoreductase n=1 Tax=Paraeggerthella hongkongensis TaxID=230658 RepID=A0A3N0B9Q5_9ACTN|nr:FAD-dependent oxidoreductase [Paraeggerthella hongkongensis]RNL43853.1 NADH:flavin oxidoreductase [Paraeggerthella hongkongensis]
METGVSRRSFLASIGAASIAVAGAGLVGCAPKSDSEQKAASKAGAAAGAPSDSSAELIPSACLNPQDYDYRQSTTDFSTLFSSVKIGSMESSHRMIKSPAGSATYLGGLTDEFLQYYVNLAKGGVEIIWVEGELVSLITGETAAPNAEEFCKRLVDECARYGASLGLQWAQFGPDVAELTVDQILAFEDVAVDLAKTIQGMGFKALEINAAGFNIGEHFLSRFHNTRTDQYGIGSLEDRARFITECIKKIKQTCGNDFVVQMLIDCVEENDNLTNNATLMDLDNTLTAPSNLVISIEEGIEFAKLFEAAGCDSMHLRLGPLGNHPCQFASDLYFILYGIEGATGYGTQWDFSRHFQGSLIADHSGAGMLLDVAARYKEAVSIPCGAVTYMDPAHAPDFFEQALADGKVDFFMMTRPLTVDNEYVAKLRDGRSDEIAPCTRCLHCHIGSNELNRKMGYCRVNALTQRVMTDNGPATYELNPASSPKKIMVVGGGPAGMEAARIAAARGHEVSLYEKSNSLGGLLSFASMVKGPHENLDDLAAYLKRQLEINGVNVTTGKEVDQAFISSMAPDVVILAVGGTREKTNIAGNVPVVDFDSFMTADLGENVVIYGSNAQAFDCALWLTVRKKRVAIVTPHANADLDMQQSQHAIRFMTTALYSLGVKVWPGASIKEAKDGKVVIATEVGTEVTVDCDSIVDGAEMTPNTSLLDGLSVSETYAIGDCEKPFNIALAIRAGNDIARSV